MEGSNHSFEHLPLPLKHQGIPKLHGGGSEDDRTKQNKINRQSHGNYLKGQSTQLSRFWKQRQDDRAKHHLPPIPGGIPILLQIDPEVDIDFLRSAFDFEIVSELEEGFIIISTDEIDMAKFNQEVDNFMNNLPRKGGAAKIFGLAQEADRLQRILSDELYEIWSTLKSDQVYTVDIGVECSGKIKLPEYPRKNEDESDEQFKLKVNRWKRNRDEKYIQWDETKIKREEELERIIGIYSGSIVDCFDNEKSITELPDSFTARVQINGKGLRDIANNYGYIFEIVLPDKIQVPESTLNEGTSAQSTIKILPPDNSAPKVCIIDSGIQEKHKYIQQAIDSANSHCYLKHTNDSSDFVPGGGHGTRVAGSVLYPDGIPTSGNYKLPCWIRNARVLDNNNGMPDYLQPSKLLSRIVETYHKNLKDKTKVFNHSIGTRVPCRLKHMSSWAATVDDLSYENDVLFIQSAGNIERNSTHTQMPGIKQMLSSGKKYPEYLLEDCCRISNPAQSLQALTVGSVCINEYKKHDVKSLGGKDKPSAFSRSGPGIWDVIKPDVVEYGGSCAVNSTTPIYVTAPSEICPELIRTSPPGPAYSKDAIGTSFATPKVSYIAAELQRLFSAEPSLLYRALIVQSARWPEWAWNSTSDKYSTAIRHIGYGIPDLQRATTNNEYRVTLITNDIKEIGTREAHIYQVTIPQEMREIGEDFDILVEVTLSYSAKPRRTRRSIRRYLSTWLDWESSRLGEEPETFRRRMFETGSIINDEGDIPWIIGTRSDRGQSDGFRRGAGTIQKDWAIIESHHLRESFCIAVRGHEGWDAAFKANYALVVSFEAINQDIAIYEPIRSYVEVEATVQEDEIEIEMIDKEE